MKKYLIGLVGNHVTKWDNGRNLIVRGLNIDFLQSNGIIIKPIFNKGSKKR